MTIKILPFKRFLEWASTSYQSLGSNHNTLRRLIVRNSFKHSFRGQYYFVSPIIFITICLGINITQAYSNNPQMFFLYFLNLSRLANVLQYILSFNAFPLFTSHSLGRKHHSLFYINIEIVLEGADWHWLYFVSTFNIPSVTFPELFTKDSLQKISEKLGGNENFINSSQTTLRSWPARKNCGQQK